MPREGEQDSETTELGEPAPTILTHPAQKQTDRCHPSEIRPLTIQESARCQSFPDIWNFANDSTTI